ncbi:MAG: c-type cytochrome [Gemmatimonadales bacterium]
MPTAFPEDARKSRITKGRRRFRIGAAGLAVVLAGLSCSKAPTSQPTPSGGPDAAPGAPAPGEAARPRQGPPPGGVPGAPRQGAPRRRQPPNPMAQDTARRAMVDSILRTIAGREHEPAGKVFKNVKLLADMPAADFLKTMDETYGRGLGWTCNNCHTVGQFESDSKKNKVLARQMERMTQQLNSKEFPRIKELDKEFEHVSCVTCHRGSEHIANKMAVPEAPPRGERR